MGTAGKAVDYRA